MEVGNLRGLNILCIDGGGVRGLSSLLLLQEVMQRLGGLGNDKPLRPVDYFDVIAGTGTGGVSACMLGRLRMSIDEAITAHQQLVKHVFSDRKASIREAYSGDRLKESLRSIVRKATGHENERMLDDQAEVDRCKTMVFAMLKDHMTAGIPTIFRSYEAVANSGPDCTVWEALYATMAHPDLFKSIKISDSLIPVPFVGGELGCSNPMNAVLREVKDIYPDRHVSCILSIGAGHTRTIHVPDPSLPQRVLRSPAIIAMKNMATDSERVAEEMARRFRGTAGVYYRFNVDQGTQDVKVDEWEKEGELAAHTRSYMTKHETNQRMNQAVRAIKKKETTVATINIDGQIQFFSRSKGIKVKQCPTPTPVFTGRDRLVKQLGECIAGEAHTRQVCVVYGLGGVGKTQLALKTIEENRDKWTHVVFVDASSKQSIENMLHAFAEAQDIGTTYTDTICWLGTCQERWLVLFDNADDPSVAIHEYFPGGNHGSILITTRLTSLVHLAHGPSSFSHIQVPNMDRQDAVGLLLKTARIQHHELLDSEMEAATVLVQDLGFLALAIVQAGAYIWYSQHIIISRYRLLFLECHQRALEEYNILPRKVDEYARTVYTTWVMCYDLLGPESKVVLWLISFLHHGNITETLFERAALGLRSYTPEVHPTGIEATAYSYMRQYLGKLMSPSGRWDAFSFSGIIGKISSCSLIEFDRANLAYSVHVLVRDWARTMIKPEPHYRLALECATTLLVLSIDYDSSRDSGGFLEELELHVDKILLEHSDVGGNAKARFAKVLKVMNQWSRVAVLEEQVLKNRQQALGEDHPHTLTSMSALATTYRNQGRWSEAESLFVRVLAVRKLVLGEEDPETLTSMNDLASTYWNQGRYIDGESLGMSVLEARKRVLGEEHPDTLISMNTLALTYKRLGQWDMAESMHIRALDVRKRVLGEEHPHTLSSMDNLASIYSRQGRWDEAELLSLRVLNARKRLLGEEHTHTLTTMGNLAMTYWSQGRRDEAELLQVQVLNARKRVLGEEHPDTLTSMANLAKTYHSLGRWDTAESMEMQVLNARKRVLGEEHPDTLTSMDNLAKTYHSQGRWHILESMQAQVLDARKRVLGREHPDTLTSMANLATTYHSLGRWDMAESMDIQVLDARKRVLGEEHPDTLTCMANLATTYHSQGRWDMVESMQAQVLDVRKRVLGEEHPATLTSMNSLAVTYCSQGRWDIAGSMQMQVLDVRKRLLGEDHPATLISMDSLAATYQKLGRWDMAESVQMRALDACKRVLGEEHPDTLTCMNNLATTYRSQGRWDMAESIEMQVLDVRKRVLGREHPHTLTSLNNLASTLQNQDRTDEAELLCVDVLNTVKRVLGNNHPHTLTCMNNLASIYEKQSRWGEAESLYFQVLNARKRVLGEEHPDTLTTMHGYAWACCNQGRWDNAASLCARAIDAREQVLGEEHPDTLNSIHCLAWTYWKQGHSEKADELLVQLINTQARTTGHEHPRVLQAKRDLGIVRSERAAAAGANCAVYDWEAREHPNDQPPTAIKVTSCPARLLLTSPVIVPYVSFLFLFIFFPVAITFCAYLYVSC